MYFKEQGDDTSVGCHNMMVTNFMVTILLVLFDVLHFTFYLSNFDFEKADRYNMESSR